MDQFGSISQLQQKYNVRGIPHAFVIADSKVMFSGHPMEPSFENTIQVAVQNFMNKRSDMSRDDLMKLPVGELKNILRSKGLSAAGCIEKADLVDRIKGK